VGLNGQDRPSDLSFGGDAASRLYSGSLGVNTDEEVFRMAPPVLGAASVEHGGGQCRDATS